MWALLLETDKRDLFLRVMLALKVLFSEHG